MIILTNAVIYSFNQVTPQPHALAIRNGKIHASGEAAMESIGRAEESQRIDLGGRVVLPGLTDAHIHLEHYGLALQKVDCELPTKAEVLAQIAERAQKTVPGEWILGHGWNQNSWDEGQFPTARELDQAAPRNPVYLTAKSLHAGWGNSLALAAARITPQTADPVNGRIGRDQGGKPNGILFESAMNLVSAAVPEPNLEQVQEAILNAQKRLWGLGITGVHDFDRSRCFAALQELRQKNLLRLRVTKSLPVESLDAVIETGLRSGFGDDWLRIGSIKAFGDGALGPHTAAMLQPYEGEPENRGMLLLDGEELFECGRKASQNGLSLAVHAIGDRAVHELLNAYEQLRQFEKENHLPHLRHRIEHVQVINQHDAGRLAQLGVIASMQPIHALSDMQMAEQYWGERARLSYAWQTQLEFGAHLAFGSDAPVDSPNPFWGLFAAAARRQPGSPAESRWYPEQRVSLMDALLAYTTGAAFAAGTEKQQGQLAPGYLADLIVLDEDPFRLSEDELRALKPTGVMIGGEWVLREF